MAGTSQAMTTDSFTTEARRYAALLAGGIDSTA